MLKFEPGLAIYTIITFLVLFVVLWKTAWPKILSALEERDARIRTSLEEADKAKEEAERIMAEYKDMLAKARKESSEIIRQGTEKAEQVREELIVKAREDAASLMEKTRKDLDRERDKAIQEMKVKSIDLSVAIAAKIITSSLTKEQQAALAREAFKEMETGQ